MEQQMKMFQEDRNLPFSVYIAQDEKFSWHCHKHMELDYCSEGALHDQGKRRKLRLPAWRFCDYPYNGRPHSNS